MRMLPKYLFKGEVVFWIKIPHIQKYKKKLSEVPKKQKGFSIAKALLFIS